jgi:hypothetical protein
MGQLDRSASDENLRTDSRGLGLVNIGRARHGKSQLPYKSVL